MSKDNDLRIWRALTRFNKREEVMTVAHVGRRTVDDFTREKSPIVDQVEAQFFGREPLPPPPAYRPPAQEDAAKTSLKPWKANLAKLGAFALIHERFFNDAQLDSLFSPRWEMKRPQKERQASEASIFGRVMRAGHRRVGRAR
ncbi:hypothetical protein ABZ923_31445 [Streptomyces sp. NPDC046881]|uniref:hypothetical protein n=1 Tax=Streptomyces sp. NPDC046881 TaxID=3155374 RepID=UPI0033E06D69